MKHFFILALAVSAFISCSDSTAGKAESTTDSTATEDTELLMSKTEIVDQLVKLGATKEVAEKEAEFAEQEHKRIMDSLKKEEQKKK